ncbi:conserved protein of unknown function [Xenorhabdus poinarii G6]|uniref:Repressor n=1 Tax=Xenorhabdus poinarii G6 TaxID=1354304 RepID=A0A068R5H7_9GAMM|nr:hypothetical protein [Xenorhabdus poinarii]CDG21370.1 conserved protein of unknown function [Xenorhabdus poinarii G6]
MPTKHINDSIWRLVEKETVKAVIELKEPVKDTTVLEWLIRKGLDTISDEDYRKFSKKNA